MENFFWTLAAGLAVAAIVSVVGSAFLRPKLFMDLYLHLLIGCLMGLAFGGGVAVGGNERLGVAIVMTTTLVCAALILILKPVAMHQASQKPGDE